MNSLPRVRAGLLRHPLEDQVLVYDPRDEQVHLLDPATACVLELLEEGGWTAEGIAYEVGHRLGVSPDAGFLTLAVDELRKAKLLDKSGAMPEPLVDVTRRDVIRRLALTGAAAVLVPAVATLTATKGYAQGSVTLLPDGTACPGGNSTCSSGLCCAGTCASTCSVAVGQPCPNGNSQCASGICCSGVCASVACGSLASCSTCQTDGECSNGNCNNVNLCGNTGTGSPNGTACTGHGTCCSQNCVGTAQNKTCQPA
jgi:hypothetical protein